MHIFLLCLSVVAINGAHYPHYLLVLPTTGGERISGVSERLIFVVANLSQGRHEGAAGIAAVAVRCVQRSACAICAVGGLRGPAGAAGRPAHHGLRGAALR